MRRVAVHDDTVEIEDDAFKHEHHHGRPYNADAAFVAAALHDLGLLAAYESEGKPFEVDSADAAERVALENGLAPDIAKLVWNASASVRRARSARLSRAHRKGRRC